ncbi:hypothetical protein CsatB_009240 [Cannabis sativa]
MASNNASNNIKVSISSPKSVTGEAPASSPKGGYCLCSPTAHQGSFRCRFHRSRPSSPVAWMKRSNSMPTNNNSVTSLSHNSSSVESTT